MNDEDFKKLRREKPAGLDRLPPHSVEAEQGVLGCVLLDGQCLNQCVEQLRAGSLAFYDLRHQLIYGTLLDMQMAGQAVDLVTLQQRLKGRGELENVGGLVYLAGLPDKVPSAAHLEDYLKIVREKFQVRKLVAFCTEVAARAQEFDGDVGKLLGEVELDMAALASRHVVATEVTMRELVHRASRKLEEMHYTRGQMQLEGLPTGEKGCYLDKLLGGIAQDGDEGGDYGVIMGRPGSGKTTKAMNIVEYLAKDYEWFERLSAEEHEKQKAAGADGLTVEEREDGPRYAIRRQGIPVAVFSIEMTSFSLGFRMLFARAGVDMAQFKQGFGHRNDVAKLIKAGQELAAANIYVDDAGAQTIGQIASKARRMARQYGIKLFVLDYIQLVDHEDGNGYDRVKEITKISRVIMGLKKSLRVPWIVLAQMNREIEKSTQGGRAERRPMLSDLKDCGALEQDADWVLCCHKVSRREVDEGEPSDQQIMDEVAARNKWPWSHKPYRVDMVLLKHRDGPTGTAQEVFMSNLGQFHDWHLWKVRHGVEGLKQGESKRLAEGDEEL